MCVKVDNKENDMCEQHNTEVSIRRKPYCAPRKSFAPLHRDFKMFKLWYKPRKHSTTTSQSSPRL